MPSVRVRPSYLFPHVAVVVRPLAVLGFLVNAALAQSAPPPVTPPEGAGLDGLMETMGLKPRPVPAPDFVRRSRPDEGRMNYIPVGTLHPERAVKVMTPAEVAATTDMLDQARMNQQRRAGLKPAPVPMKNTDRKSAAAKPIN